MPKFHTLRVKDVRKETEDTVSVAFDVPVTLADDFQFQHGQYLTLKADINGEEVRRSYSICTSPLDGELRVAIKKVENGRFSTFANEKLIIGDRLDVMTPMGRFTTALDEKNAKHYAAFAAGSGITPIMSILKTVLQKEPNSTFTLFYGNRRADSIIFKEEIEGLKNTYLTRLRLHHILSREAIGSQLFEGRINAEKCEKICKFILDVDSVDEFFICGPEDMIFAVKDTLLAKGVAEQKIHFELFTSPAGKLGQTSKSAKKRAYTEGDNAVQIILDGHSINFNMDATENILDAALANGADLPYACKGGVCCTCRAKLKEGEVEMDVNYALEQWEVNQGFILTCQAHPTTQKVVVDFDEQ